MLGAGRSAALRAAKTAGCLYQAAVFDGPAPLGLAWTVRENGLFELAEAAPAVLRAFSGRRA